MSGLTGRTDVGTVEDLHASATKACGLDDFGSDDDNYREALGMLLESYRRDADLTEIGSKMNRFFVRNALVARLMSEAAWKQYPQHATCRSSGRSSSPGCRAPAPPRCTG